MPRSARDPRLTLALKIGIILIAVIVWQTLALVFLWHRGLGRAGARFEEATRAEEENIVRSDFPDVDFTKVYPDLAESDIDLLQRECFRVRYVYCPFVQFEPAPFSGKFVEVTEAGYRKGRSDQPWPPREQDLVVFVFGGSTTFSYGLPDGQTVVSALQDRLTQAFPGRSVQCYNFGRGYYFSTQERILFASLLQRPPDLAVFIDGLNDFRYHDGAPDLSVELYRHVAPDLPAPHRPKLLTDESRGKAVDRVLARYRHNVRITSAIAAEYGSAVVFVGQPVPFFDFRREPDTYPYPLAACGHELCEWGYRRFQHAAPTFGPRFVWCGDAFSRAESIMYADRVHYSRQGAEILARTIVDRASRAGLLSRLTR